MTFVRKRGTFLCILFLSVLFPGISHGSLLGTLTSVVNGVLKGVSSSVSDLISKVNPSGSGNLTVLSPVTTGIGGIVNSITGFVCNKLYSQFKDIGGNPSIVTKLGTVVGKYVKIEGISVVASFLSIPYAKPPLGNLRFKRAEPIETWNGVLMANKKAPPCMQFAINGASSQQSPFPPTEDCLVLNVFVPKQCVKLGKLQVLLWIHGGAFAIGSSAIYDGSLVSFYGQSIVVTVNYRLGVFGFLKADPDEAPGNMGLTDQLLAIQWVQDNIESFGGDPNKITLIGESAGAQSISLHLISPLTRNLFHRAIMESGSMYAVIFTDTPEMSQSKANAIAEAMDCLDDPEGIVYCLRGVNATQLSMAENLLRPRFGLFSQPSIGDEFLPNHPIQSYDSGDIAPVEIITGNLKDEGSLFLNLGLPNIFPFTAEPQLNLTYAKTLIPIILEMLPPYMQKKASRFYLKNIPENDSASIVEALKFVIGDLAFFCPTHYLANAEKTKDTYAYWWTYLSSKSPNSDWVGVFHGVDVPYVFGFPLVSLDQYTLGDAAFSAYVMREFLKFAEKGVPPSSYNVLKKTRWNQFVEGNATTFEIKGILGENIDFPRREACQFWRPFFDDYANYYSPLYS